PIRCERPVLERQPVLTPAAGDAVASLHVFGQRQHAIAVRTADAIRERRDPAVAVPRQPEGMARAIRTLEQIAGLHVLGDVDHLLAVWTADPGCGHMPSTRFRRPRSKPATTSSSTVMTGTAARPVFATSSLRAPASSATFFASNTMS